MLKTHTYRGIIVQGRGMPSFLLPGSRLFQSRYYAEDLPAEKQRLFVSVPPVSGAK